MKLRYGIFVLTSASACQDGKGANQLSSDEAKPQQTRRAVAMGQSDFTRVRSTHVT